MRFDWQHKPGVEVQELLGTCPAGEYRIVSAQDVPDGLLSGGLLAKGHSALLLCSGTRNGRIYFMVNLNRLDGGEVDQMPYCIAYDGTSPIPSGLLIQHGSYHGDRTTKLPLDFDNFVRSSGLYPLPTMPLAKSGHLEDLRIPSQEAAFNCLVQKLQTVFPEEGTARLDV